MGPFEKGFIYYTKSCSCVVLNIILSRINSSFHFLFNFEFIFIDLRINWEKIFNQKLIEAESDITRDI